MKRLLLLLILLVFGRAATAETGQPLKIGLFPNLTPITLIAMYQPLREHLEQSLLRPVELATAPDFRSFVERTRSGAYDVVLTAPHLARLAEQEGDYLAVATYDEELRALLIVTKSSPATRITELRGARIAMPDPLAVVNMLGRAMLAKAGVGPNEYTLVNAHSHNGAALAVLRGDSQAAIVGSIPFAQVPQATRDGLRILAASKPIPNQVWLIRKDLPLRERKAFLGALLDYADTPSGADFLKSHGCGGIRPIRPGALKTLDPFANEVRKQLESRQ